MRWRHLIIVAVALAGCSRREPGGFLGLPDDMRVADEPVEIEVEGKPRRVEFVSAVQTATFATYRETRAAGRILVEERRGPWVYWATEDNRDIRLDHAARWVTVIERFRTRQD